MPVQFKNNATALLAASISSGATTVVLSAGQGQRFPTLTSGQYFFGTLFDANGNYEIIKVTARAGDSLTAVRAQDGTLALAFNAGDGFALRPVAASLANFPQFDSDNTFTGANTFQDDVTITAPLTGTSAAFSGALSAPTASFSSAVAVPTAPFSDNTTKAASTAFVRANGVPIGTVIMYPSSTSPLGWFVCDGSFLSRADYSALFAVIGTTFGAGDGSTTFNLPNFLNRMPIGAGGSYGLNSQGGSKDAVAISHTHTATQAAHNHYISGGSQSSTLSSTTTLSSTGNTSSGLLPNENFEYSLLGSTTTATTGLTSSATPAITVNAAGESGTDKNLPPYLGILFLIKAL